MLRPFAVLLLSVAVAPAFGQSRAYPPELEGARGEVYKQVDGVELKLWVFEPAGHSPADARPAIVFFFGGGWNSGSPGQFQQQCRRLASLGMVAITADYRVRSRHNVLADRCVADAKSAIRYVRANAKRLGIDPKRIVAGGGSAGGHLAACTATIPTLDEPHEDLSVSSVPNALALFNPALVLAPHDLNPEKKPRGGALSERTGVEPREISPIHHVRRGLPPTIIFHGRADATVSFASVEAYTRAAVAAGNRCELKGYAGQGHGFFNHGRGAATRQGAGQGYRQTMAALEGFLASLGYLPPNAPKTR